MSAAAASFDLRLIETAVATLPCVVRGPRAGAQLLIIPPLFEEMNRTRRLLAGIGQQLAEAGIGSWLPDLPGTGDSELPGAAMDWNLWRDSLRALSEHISASTSDDLHLFSIRGGNLLADAMPARSHYRLAPVVSGERLLRELMRARVAADQERGTPVTIAELTERLSRATVELAGYPISSTLAADLRAARTVETDMPTRTADLMGDAADHVFEGPLVWRQAEPVAADRLAAEIAEDIAQWIAACGAR